MKIKKIVAKTEKEAVEKVKQTCGPNALILNIAKKQEKGSFWFIKKTMIVVTVAYDLENEIKKGQQKTDIDQQKTDIDQEKNDQPENIEDKSNNSNKLLNDSSENKKNKDYNEETVAQQNRIQSLEKMLADMSERLMSSGFTLNNTRIFENSIMQIFYEALVKQGVLDYIAKEILDQVMETVGDEKTLDISFVSACVYSKILEVIKKPTPIVSQENALFIFFVGPTGVGKTTTIAKLASRIVIEQNIKIGLITADTYRIAAVEQLKVYAEILNLDINVIYEKQDFITSAQNMSLTKDIVFVDTAGRSHKNKENLLDLKELINVPEISEKYLVLSMTTKYEDLINIIGTYSDIGKFKLILTKFDETTHYGSIFNLCFNLGLEVVYITTGQNVPDDIELLKPERIAKALLGLETGL